MKVIGMDFTSCPGRAKPITYLSCNLENGVLSARDFRNLENFNAFETVLTAGGPWIAGIDFPFGQSRRFLETVGWPAFWADYVKFVLDREGFCKTLNDYRKPRRKGDREHRRVTDNVAESISPQKLHVAPVGKMFFEGAPRLLKAEVMIPGLQKGDPTRIVVEAYPGVLARKFIGKQPYKNDSKKKQTNDQRETRRELLRQITEAHLVEYGISVVADATLADDPTGDQLDALLCAIQAAWSWMQRESGFGAPSNIEHTLEGWIAGPKCRIVALTEPLRKSLEPYSDRIMAAFVYGSATKGEDTASSDIDLMVIGDDLSYSDLYAASQNVENVLRRKVSPTSLSPKDWWRKASAKSSFISKINALPKIFVLGSKKDLQP